MKMSINGIDDLQKKLKKNANMDTIKQILKKHGSEMNQKAARNVPVDTGTLKRSIMLSMHDGGYTWRVKALVNYASYVEYGTSEQSAQPFLRPAFYEQRQELMKDLRKITK